MSEKIKAHHLERGAYVYVRQPPHQVRNHLERKERLSALAARAEQLGFLLPSCFGARAPNCKSYSIVISTPLVFVSMSGLN